jgi:hypothetical protein
MSVAEASLISLIIKEMEMVRSVALPSDWVCNGRELKPKIGATSANTWLFDGKEIKPKIGATSGNTWVWNGTELKRKIGATSADTWVITGGKANPKVSPSSTNTVSVGTLPILVIAGGLVLRLW